MYGCLHAALHYSPGLESPRSSSAPPSAVLPLPPARPLPSTARLHHSLHTSSAAIITRMQSSLLLSPRRRCRSLFYSLSLSLSLSLSGPHLDFNILAQLTFFTHEPKHGPPQPTAPAVRAGCWWCSTAPSQDWPCLPSPQARSSPSSVTMLQGAGAPLAHHRHARGGNLAFNGWQPRLQRLATLPSTVGNLAFNGWQPCLQRLATLPSTVGKTPAPMRILSSPTSLLGYYATPSA